MAYTLYVIVQNYGTQQRHRSAWSSAYPDHSLCCLYDMLALMECTFNFYAPAMIMAGALSVTPVRPSLRTHFTYVCPDDVCSLARIFFIRIL